MEYPKTFDCDFIANNNCLLDMADWAFEKYDIKDLSLEVFGRNDFCLNNKSEKKFYVDYLKYLDSKIYWTKERVDDKKENT